MRRIFSLFLILSFVVNISAYDIHDSNDQKSANTIPSQKEITENNNGSYNSLGWKIGGVLVTACALGLTLYHFVPICDRKMIYRLDPVENFVKLPENPDIHNIKVVMTGNNGRYPKGIVDEGLWNDLFCYDRGYEKRTAIVDASNRSGLGGGGVDGCIFKKMGERARPYISANLEPYRDRGGQVIIDAHTNMPVRIETGGAIIHSSFDIADGYDNIPYVIQGVSPIIHNQSDFPKLYSAYYNATRLAIIRGCKRLLVPALGMAIFFRPDPGVDSDILGKECADVALAAISDARRDVDIEVIFTDFGPQRHPFYQRLNELRVPQILAT